MTHPVISSAFVCPLHPPNANFICDWSLAVAEVGVAGGVEDAGLDGAVLVVESVVLVDEGPVLEHAVAPVDPLGAEVSKLISKLI